MQLKIKISLLQVRVVELVFYCPQVCSSRSQYCFTLNSGATSEELLAEFSNYGVKVVLISGDVSDFADAKRMVEKSRAGSVDVLVNKWNYSRSLMPR